MWHFIKYILISLSVLALAIFFYSNFDDFIQLKFGIPYIGTWQSIPLSQNLVMIIAFCLGVFWAGFLGAFRFGPTREMKRNERKLKVQVKDLNEKLEKQKELLNSQMVSSARAPAVLASSITEALVESTPDSEEKLEEENPSNSDESITHLPPLK